MTKLPASFTETIVATLGSYWDRAGALTTSDGARAAMQANLSRSLHAGELATVPLAYIIMMANAGHEPAQRALREWIATYIDSDRFNDLPVQARDFALKVMLEKEPPGYQRGHKIIDTWTRDAVINFLVAMAMERWRIKKAQAAALMAIVLKERGLKPASTRGVLDIFDARNSLGARTVAFMMAAAPDDDEPSGGGTAV
jgi:hypothetical protein